MASVTTLSIRRCSGIVVLVELRWCVVSGAKVSSALKFSRSRRTFVCPLLRLLLLLLLFVLRPRRCLLRFVFSCQFLRAGVVAQCGSLREVRVDAREEGDEVREKRHPVWGLVVGVAEKMCGVKRRAGRRSGLSRACGKESWCGVGCEERRAVSIFWFGAKF
ncbi:hypothetical protein BDV95DRAFT_582311 [Massariosphaeria phaeospora]|uniref:Uncharacterized protein n=1 Tax=Massariosphaeria phaeospora TaxID=100035 RepID=A0A7C8M6V9_9PLEO|nr:hypothetical protein BDV95DRAFT_582311 [Massariosphaeria phaeospora]